VCGSESAQQEHDDADAPANGGLSSVGDVAKDRRSTVAAPGASVTRSTRRQPLPPGVATKETTSTIALGR
jgi:hypothetical protein